jgi:hypothetical protein
MRKGLATLFVLLSLGPTLAVPVTLWHHHDAASAPSASGHRCDASSPESPARHHADGESGEQCPVCVFSKLVNVELPVATTLVVEIRPSVPVVTPTTRVVVDALPLSHDARGPPATAPVA